MLRNYIKIAWRSILTRKFYTFLNISGLTIAISCCMLIYLYAGYNLSFDRYHKNAGNVFRLVMELHLDKTEFDKGAPYIEYQTLKTQYPQVDKAAFLISNQSFIVNINGDVNKRFKEENTVSFTNSEWFDLFSHNWIQGDAHVLDVPGNVVLTEKAVRKYFGNTDPMGKTILFDGKPVKVAGILADAPFNTDLKGDVFLSFSSLNTLIPEYATDKYFLNDWGDIGSIYTAFVSLKNPGDQAVVEQQLLAESKKHFGVNAKLFVFKLLPLNQVHFDTRYGGTVQKPMLWNLMIIGILIMAIAVINYINIVVAQQTKRGVEIATRKVLGGSTWQIFLQFIVEALLNSAIAIIAAFAVVLLMLPVANTYLFVDEPVYILSYFNLLAFTGIVLLCITAGTGIYPALLLSKVNIMRAMKNNLLNIPAGFGRRVLVVFQNTVTQALIICTIIMMMQVYYLRNTDIGFNRKSVITIPVGQLSATQKEQFSQSLRQMPAVQSFSFCNKPPSSNSQRGATFQYDNRVKWEVTPVRFAIGDSAYTRTFGLHLVAGRNVRNGQATAEFLINQTMAKMLENKHPENVIGKPISTGDYKGVVVGIVKDFNVKSLIEPIEPSMILQINELQTNLAVKLSGDETSATLNNLQQSYQRILPDQVFSFQFVDEQIAQLYKKENIQQKLIWLGAVIAIVISSLGLLGLVSLVTLQRTKEIGIRKVLGASVTQIGLLISNDFLVMILVSFAIAAPISWWAMDKWLQGFAHRIEVHWWVFALGGFTALLIAMLTVSVQSIKAALANPVKSLRSE